MTIQDEIRVLYQPYSNEVFIRMENMSNSDYVALMTLRLSKGEVELLSQFGIVVNKWDMPVVWVGCSIFKVLLK